MAWLKLIRWTNLLIIFLTQLLAWVCVILPMQRLASQPLLSTGLHFIFLSVSTVLIAAAGYIINDYFDIRIDTINKPDKMILERRIPRRWAIITHSVLNAIALILAGAVAHKAGHYEWLLVQVLCTVLLWFYSTHFKRQFMTGNVVVALLTGLTIVVMMVYEPVMHEYFWKPPFITARYSVIPNPVWVLGVYAYFAFMLTWMREIVKDMEDFKGDEAEGCITMPIKWGLLKASRFVQLLSILAIIPLVIAGIRLMNERWLPLGMYSIGALALPLLVWTFYIPRKATTEHYKEASRLLKLIMVLGIGSLIIYYRQAHG